MWIISSASGGNLIKLIIYINDLNSILINCNYNLIIYYLHWCDEILIKLYFPLLADYTIHKNIIFNFKKYKNYKTNQTNLLE